MPPADLNHQGVPEVWRPFIADHAEITGVITMVGPGKKSDATYVKLDTGDILPRREPGDRRASDGLLRLA